MNVFKYISNIEYSINSSYQFMWCISFTTETADKHN